MSTEEHSPDCGHPNLHRLVAAAAQNSNGDGVSSGGSIRLARPSGRRPLLALVSPLGRTEWPLLARRPAAIVLICDPEKEAVLPPMRLSQLFGFARREAQIAALLAQELDLNEAAERLGLSRATVHSHLKHIMARRIPTAKLNWFQCCFAAYRASNTGKSHDAVRSPGWRGGGARLASDNCRSRAIMETY